jgi:hypothetical protein
MKSNYRNVLMLLAFSIITVISLISRSAVSEVCKAEWEIVTKSTGQQATSGTSKSPDQKKNKFTDLDLVIPTLVFGL